MLFMIVEHFKNGDAGPVYRRFRTDGRLTPAGVHYVSSWVSADLAHCYQVMEAPDRASLDRCERWADLVDFEVGPVITSAQALDAVVPRL